MADRSAPRRPTRRPPGAAASLALALLAGAASPARAAEACQTTLRYDAHAGAAEVERGGKVHPVEPGALLPWPGTLCVEVRGISTALQVVEVATEATDTSGLSGLLQLFQGLKPIGQRFEDTSAGVQDLSNRLARLRAEKGPLQGALEQIQRLTDGPAGVATARSAARVVAARMAAEPGKTDALAAELRGRLGDAWGCPPGAPAGCAPRLLPAAGLVEAYADLDRALGAYLLSPLAEQEEELTEAARKVLAQVPAALAQAREAEALVRAVATASGTFRRGPLSPGLLSGLKVRVAVSPRHEPWLEGLSPAQAGDLGVTFRDQAGIRISAGALAVVVPSARLPRYGNVGGVLATTGTVDARPQVGLSLDLSYRWLDWSETGGPTVWLPQLLVTPISPSAPGFGVGAAISWWQLKAAVGAIWLQQEQPGAPLGTPIGPGEDVPVSRGYPASPRFYAALGVRIP